MDEQQDHAPTLSSCPVGPHPSGSSVGPGPHPSTGALVFGAADQRDAVRCRLRADRWLVVDVDLGPESRGRLSQAIDEAIERELAERGLATPGTVGVADADAALSDQLFRARRSGAQGIAVVLGLLRRAAGPLGAIAPEDCGTLRFFAAATRERPLVLLLDARDAETPAFADPVPLGRAICPDPTDEPPPAAEPDLKHTAGAAVVAREEAWRGWTLQLAAARGPQPLAALERLFSESYMPLANAIATGLDDARARAARDEFHATFARGYMEASPTLAATAKRPRMVLDAHDVAARIARLHGARSTRLLLVDAMRWDVARLVEERLVVRLGARASLTDELILWSALPTTTMRQLETIARGVEALRSPADLEPEEPPRGRTVEYVRRLRVGPREVHKLDVVEARLQSMRSGVLGSLPEIADVAAEAIARHAETLAPRTLLFVFGDHGFEIDRAGGPRQGGASPEEVLVGAFALLVGEVH
jgi:hypothetical protein